MRFSTWGADLTSTVMSLEVAVAGQCGCRCRGDCSSRYYNGVWCMADKWLHIIELPWNHNILFWWSSSISVWLMKLWLVEVCSSIINTFTRRCSTDAISCFSWKHSFWHCEIVMIRIKNINWIQNLSDIKHQSAKPCALFPALCSVCSCLLVWGWRCRDTFGLTIWSQVCCSVQPVSLHNLQPDKQQRERERERI